MIGPAAKKAYVLENMLSKTTAPPMTMQSKKSVAKGPKASTAQYRGTKVLGKYERTAGGKTKRTGVR